MRQVVEETKSTVKSGTSCYHCGDFCSNLDIRVGDKIFCCNGCKLVFELLSEKDLCAYYSLGHAPGRTPEEAGFSSRFAYLDDQKVITQLVQFSDGKLSRLTLYIPGIHCSSCIWLLENLFKVNEAILNSKVDFIRKSLDISFNAQKISLRELIELLTSLGYEPEINLATLQKNVDHRTDRELYIKIGIAGFAFGNIMLLSLPDYLSRHDPLPADFLAFFGYLSIFLALPVFFYSSLEYFKSAFSGLRQKTINMDVPISLGIITLFTRSFFEIMLGSGSGYMDSFTGLVFLLLIGKLFQKKTFDNLSFERDYRSYFPVSVLRKEKNKIKSTPLNQLNIGDRIFIRNQEIIPADAVLIGGEGFIDYSFVTGESEPVQKISGDLIYAGGKQIGNQLELEIIKNVSSSYLTQLWNNPIFSKAKSSRLTSVANRVSKYFTLIVLSVALGAALYWLKTDLSTALNAFTAVLIVACPCALALSTPFTLGNTLRFFGKNDLYLKNTAVIEQIARINTIVFDKTGTLTQPQKTNVRFKKAVNTPDLTAEEQTGVKSIVSHSTHPLSRLIYAYIPVTTAATVQDLREIPGKGLSGNVFSRSYKIGSAEYTSSDSVSQKGIPSTQVHLTINDVYRGFYEIVQQYRDKLEPTIARLRKQFNIMLLTGDNTREKNTLRKIFGTADSLFFNQSPYDKLKFIKNRQARNDHVMMIGDGLNDAGALIQSDVGISLAENVNLFTPASDAILGASGFSKLFDFIRLSKISLKIIMASFVLSFFYNLAGLFFAVQGALSPLVAAVLMPLSSISVILFTTGITRFLANKIFKPEKGSKQ